MESNMYCCLCKTELICYDDVNNIGLRLDFMKCPQCGVKADIILSSGELKNVKPSNRQLLTDRIKQCQGAQKCPYDGDVRCIYAFGEGCLIKEVRCKTNCVIAERMEF